MQLGCGWPGLKLPKAPDACPPGWAAPTDVALPTAAPTAGSASLGLEVGTGGSSISSGRRQVLQLAAASGSSGWKLRQQAARWGPLLGVGHLDEHEVGPILAGGDLQRGGGVPGTEDPGAVPRAQLHAVRLQAACAAAGSHRTQALRSCVRAECSDRREVLAADAHVQHRALALAS
jgi:hypothetical protein